MSQNIEEKSNLETEASVISTSVNFLEEYEKINETYSDDDVK